MHSNYSLTVLNEFFKYDFHVILLKHNSKEPLTKWKEEKNWIKDVSQIDQNCNIGIICDKLLVFDADTKEAIEFLESNFEIFNQTTTVITRKGKHYYFLKSEDFTAKNEKIYKNDVKIDIKADNSYVVAPPSKIDNHEYVFEKDLSQIKTLSFDEYETLVYKIKDKLNLHEKTEHKKEPLHTHEIDIEQLKKIILQRYEEGHRQNIIMYMSGWLRKEGISRETVEQIVTEICFEAKDKDIKQRLSAVEQAWRKNASELKGISGLTELGYLEQDLKDCLSSEKSKLEPLGNSFYTDGTFVYFARETKNMTVFEMIGPYFLLKSKIYHDANILYEIEHDGKTEIMKEVKDLETIRKITGKAVINEKKFLEWLNYETVKEIPKKFIRAQTGWKNGVFYHPAIQTEDLWGQWYWHKKIKQYRNKSEQQHELVKEALKDGRYLAVIYAFCLSSVLNEVLNVNPSALFITGPAHAGKTTVAQLGINLFLPAEDIFITTHTTTVGFELLMKSLKDIPILFDECVLKDLDLEKIVFMVAAKVGKIRGTKSLSINISDISSNVIFTSEILEQSAFKRAGAQRRFIGITIEEFSKNCFSKMTIEEIQKLKKYYGAGIDIIQFIQGNIDKIQEIRELIEADIDKYKLHSIYHIALSLLTAVRVFEQFYKEKYDNAYEYTLLTLDSQKKEFEQKIDIVKRFLDEFSQFLVRKDNQIVEPSNENKKILGEIIGQREGDNIYILTKVFQEFCQECGFEMKILIKELIKNNILIPYNYNAPRKMKKIAGTAVSTYHIKLDGINPE